MVTEPGGGGKGSAVAGARRVGVPRGPHATEPRIDARAKATGRAVYTADVGLPAMAHVAVTRSPVPHALVGAIDGTDALRLPGVLGVFSAADLARAGVGLFGRRVVDVPVLASGKVRFVGEPVAAVVADTRAAAERAAALVDVQYEELPGVFDPLEACRPGAVLVHDEAWAYEGAVVSAGDGPNVQSRQRHGDPDAVEQALAGAAFVVDRSYQTPAGHQGYLEPQACVVDASGSSIDVWASTKSPYRLVSQLAHCLGAAEEQVVVHPVLLGGDFGGKGSPMGVPLTAALSRLTGRPCRLALRYWEDLTATNPRHPAVLRIRVGADGDGRLAALHLQVVADGGAYAGYKPVPGAVLHGFGDAASGYRIDPLCIDATIVYTTSVPKGHMRSPGSPQAAFAVECAIDELAAAVGLAPGELRRRNVVRSGERDGHGHVRRQSLGVEVIDAAVDAVTKAPAPPGWCHGTGMALTERATASGETSIRLRAVDGGRLVVEVPFPETGTGSHTAVRDGLCRLLGMEPAAVEIRSVGSAALPRDAGVGASRVTASISTVLGRAADEWHRRGDVDTIEVEVTGDDQRVSSYCIQVAQVAVDPDSGEVRVLEVLSALDVADIVNERAHQMQVDGGAAMGFGFACLEDLQLEGGQVWAGHLGEFRIPTARDVPRWRTVLVRGAEGLGALNVKGVGELANVPTAAAIANAIADAVGVRIRQLPVTAEAVHRAMSDRDRLRSGEASGSGTAEARP